jgi:Flp pilus assembly protein TadG
MRDRKNQRGQLTVEFALLFAGVLVPTTFGTIFGAQILWTWHSVNDFTRQGAGYAATHCWQAAAGNVIAFMQSNVPMMPGNTQFQNGPAQIQVSYFAEDPTTGTLTPFTCDGDCTTGCVPDVVTVTVTNYQVNFLPMLPAVVMPNFQSTMPMGSCGCDPETGVCLP